MAKPLPSRFNPDLMARDGARFEAVVPLQRFERLAALLRDETADPTATADGGADDSSGEGEHGETAVSGREMHASAGFSRRKDHIVVSGRLRARYPLRCQRCLAPMTLDVDAPYELTFVANQAEADALPDELDPVVLDDTGQIDSIALYEDELILQVPLIARHADVAECAPLPANVDTTTVPDEEADAAARPRPFDVLKKLDLH